MRSRARFSKDRVREIMRRLGHYDQAILLGQLAPVRRLGSIEPTRKLMKAPLVLPLLPDMGRVSEYCRQPDELPIITVGVHELHGQLFRLCMGENSTSTVEACRVLNRPVSMHFEGWYQCRPEEYVLLEGHGLWRLIWDGAPGERPFEFASNAVANTMYMLGVRRK